MRGKINIAGNKGKWGVVLVVFLLIALYVYHSYESAWGQIPFDSGEWKRARAAHHYNTCYRMSDSLLSMLRSEEVSRERVLELLGPPDNPSSPTFWRYHLELPPTTLFGDLYWLSLLVGPERVDRAFINPG